jgi:hypothetical protein
VSFPRRLELALWALALVAVAAAILGWVRTGPASEAAPAEAIVAPAFPQPFNARLLRTAAAATVAKDPFRLDRRPADAAFGAVAEGTAAPAVEAPPPFRPPLALGGILGGPPWEAVVEGIPGRESGVLARKGDQFGELRVTAVGADKVVIRGADTTWILTLKRPWQ